MNGPHFFAEPEQVRDGSIVLVGDQARHLSTVLRARRGDPVTVADGTGALYDTRVDDTGDEIGLRIVATAHHPAAVPGLVVVHGLPKGRKFDEIVTRLSEIGVDRLVPVHTERSQVTLSGARADKALARWRAVALAAGKQSRRVRLLRVDPVGQWADVFPAGVPGAVLWEEEATAGLRRTLETLDPRAEQLVLGVGPEGGLTADEVAACGLPPATLGPTILRTETAAVVAASITLATLDRLG